MMEVMTTEMTLKMMMMTAMTAQTAPDGEPNRVRSMTWWRSPDSSSALSLVVVYIPLERNDSNVRNEKNVSIEKSFEKIELKV